jgi:hypothetical protein
MSTPTYKACQPKLFRILQKLRPHRISTAQRLPLCTFALSPQQLLVLDQMLNSPLHGRLLHHPSCSYLTIFWLAFYTIDETSLLCYTLKRGSKTPPSIFALNPPCSPLGQIITKLLGIASPAHNTSVRLPSNLPPRPHPPTPKTQTITQISPPTRSTRR